VLRAFARALANEVPKEYVFGLDMGLSENDAAIFVDELGDRGAAVGLPRTLGGLPYDQLGVTGFGVAEAADAAAGTIGLSMAGARVVLQGFGAVGAAAAERFQGLGATVVAVSTATGSVHDPARLLRLKEEVGDDCVREYGHARTAADALTVPVDILVPAAMQDVIDERVARSTTARLVVEGANLPTTKAALDVLAARGVAVVPDFIANAGGVIAAAFAMDARYSPFAADGGDVFPVISAKLRANVQAVLRQAAAEGVPSHAAALQIAQQRVRAAMQLRGQVPPGDPTPPDLGRPRSHGEAAGTPLPVA
jgi:glutamate dehydrogenase (NAD(P)+)